MTQALHIFRKDLRHQKVDLAIYAGLLVLLGFLIPMGWPGHWSSNDMLPWLLTLLQVAVPAFWLVIIARLVHEEAIAGNRQFWTTRPYRWGSLLGAKLFFLVVCIALPYIVMQWYLAFHGGVSPFQVGFPVLAAMHLLIVWIPMFLFACVTSTLVSTFFTTLGSVVVWAATLSLLLGSNGPEADAPFARLYLGILFAGIFTFLLVLLYRKRSFQLGRILMGSAAVLFLLMIFFVSKMSPASLGTLLLKARYPEGGAPQLHLHYEASTSRFTGHGDQNSMGLFSAVVPIELLGMPNGHRLHNAAMQYHLEAGGYSYTSPWRPTPLTPEGMLFRVPTAVLNHAGQADAHLTVSLAAEEIAPGESQTTAIRDRFAIPGGGSCDAIDPPNEGRSARTTVVCHFAYSVPNPVEIEATMKPGCPVPKVPMQVPTYDGGTSLDPLTHWPVNFGPHGLVGSVKDCIVQSLTTTVYRPVTRFRTSLDIPSIRLADYTGN